MDHKLLDELRSAASRTSTVLRVSIDEGSAIIRSLADRYVTDPGIVWWWTAFKEPERTFSVPYDGNGGFVILRRVIASESFLELIATDDDPVTAEAIFRGRIDEIIDLIEGQRYFEYILSALDHSWAVFDTHHNELIFCGSIVEKSRQIFK